MKTFQALGKIWECMHALAWSSESPDPDGAVTGTGGKAEAVGRPGAGPDDARMRLHHPSHQPERSPLTFPCTPSKILV